MENLSGVFSVETTQVKGVSSVVELFVKREDKIHLEVSGNKYRKLKYNIEKALADGVNTLLTFGGAFSNHIAATAAAGRLYGINTIGVIRGEELEKQINNNPTLLYAQQCGMQFKFVSRSDYRNKDSELFIESLKKEFKDFYIVPEGGTNALAIKGCEEILTATDNIFDYICVPVGTGGTISGIINSALPNQKVLGFSALKGDFLIEDISKFAKQDNWQLISDYHFGGYAKINTELVTFINQFKERHNISLDPVYTGKMMYGVYDMIKNNYFPPDSKILVIHTGGLQGIKGMNIRLKQRKLPLIQ